MIPVAMYGSDATVSAVMNIKTMIMNASDAYASGTDSQRIDTTIQIVMYASTVPDGVLLQVGFASPHLLGAVRDHLVLCEALVDWDEKAKLWAEHDRVDYTMRVAQTLIDASSADFDECLDAYWALILLTTSLCWVHGRIKERIPTRKMPN